MWNPDKKDPGCCGVLVELPLLFSFRHGAWTGASRCDESSSGSERRNNYRVHLARGTTKIENHIHAGTFGLGSGVFQSWEASSGLLDVHMYTSSSCKCESYTWRHRFAHDAVELVGVDGRSAHALGCVDVWARGRELRRIACCARGRLGSNCLQHRLPHCLAVGGGHPCVWLIRRERKLG